MRNLKEHGFKVNIVTAISIVGFVIYWTFIGGKQLARIDEVDEQSEANKSHIIVLENKSVQNSITLAEIKVELKNMNTLWLQIRNDLKQHDGR